MEIKDFVMSGSTSGQTIELRSVYRSVSINSTRNQKNNNVFLKQWRNTHLTRLDKCQGPPGSRGPKPDPIFVYFNISSVRLQ